jgi:6-phosphogluconolactonase
MINNNTERICRIFPSPLRLVEAFAQYFAERVSEAEKENQILTIALSGGSTPKLLYKVLAENYTESVSWQNVHFFWGDERCVPPEHPESNYGTAYRIFLNKITISERNIHRIRGEDDPAKEAVRYADEIIRHSAQYGGVPEFNLVFLGVGDDGHIASIFPGNNKLLNSDDICEVAQHPVLGQKRITLTGKVINNAESIFFIVTGSRKAEIIKQVFRKVSVSPQFPAAKIIPVHGTAEWWMDENAAKFLKQDCNC